MVQPRPARGGPAAALGGRRARPRVVRARAAEEGARPAARARSIATTSGTSPASPRRRRTTSPRTSTWPGSPTNGIEAVLCDQNYQFAELASCAPAACARSAASSGSTSPPTTSPARARPSTSSTRSPAPSSSGTREMGLRDALRPLGLSPGADRGSGRGAAERRTTNDERPITFVFPGGFLGHRKPLEPVLEAFEATDDPRLRLIVKAQVERKQVRAAEDAAAARPAGRAAPRRPADGRAPARARELRRLPRARRAGRGSGCRSTRRSPSAMPAITNDAPPMNEAIHDGRQRPAGRLDAQRDRASRGSPPSTPTSASCGGDRAARRRLGCAPSSPRARCAVRDTERRWADTVAGIGELLTTTRRRGSLEGFMGFSDQIERYRKRCGHRPRRPPPARAARPEPPPAPFVCGVTRSGTTLLRLMLDSHPDVAIPGETHWVPKLIKAFERSQADRRGRGQPGDRPQALGRLPPRRRRAARADQRACTR